MIRANFLKDCFLVTLILPLFFFPEDSNAHLTDITPRPKQFYNPGRSIFLGPVHLIVDDELEAAFPEPLDALRDVLGPEFGTGMPVTIGVSSEALKSTLPPAAQEALGRPESYWMEVTKESIRIVGSDMSGALFGFTTLERAVGRDRLIETGEVLDWPDIKTRALLLVVYSYHPEMTLEDYRDYIVRARRAKMNAVILHFHRSVRYTTGDWIGFGQNAWPTEDILNLVGYARRNGLEVIPGVELLTHQNNFFNDRFPDLMYNNATYDPTEEGTYEKVEGVLSEMIELYHPVKAIHIGHDEVAGYDSASEENHLLPGEEMLPKELFLQDVLRIHEYLETSGVETWMWGDMLVSPEEFPTMLDKHLNGLNGYSTIRAQIPPDVVICDWHYYNQQTEFPTLDTFIAEGHKTLGATGSRLQTILNFSHYTASADDDPAAGMIATLWDDMWLNKESGRAIVNTAGAAFWNAK